MKEYQQPFHSPVAGVITPGEIRTYTGGMVNLTSLTPDQVILEDIAHALSNQCRFSGHTAQFYSVAEHSILCAEMVPDEMKLAALLHDASEAYLVDIPTPLKMMLPQYIELEAQVMRVISEKFGFAWPLPELVKLADKAMLEQEWQNLMLNCNWATYTPDMARWKFLRMFDKITLNDK